MTALLQTVSLFCGAGGESAGKALAMHQLGLAEDQIEALAVNHWDMAIMTHATNFPTVQVVQTDITKVSAHDFGVTRVDVLWASPSCVHHSRARGGRPRDTQERAHADEVIDKWIRIADVRLLMLENVPEFMEWGPLDEEGAPIQSRRGEYFERFVQTLRDLGYTVDWRVLCAADYGDPTIRRRMFLQAAKDGIIAWPERTHADAKKYKPGDVLLPPWRSAAECIDWSIPAPSIFDRKKPLAPATCRRIAHGIMKYVVNGEPFLVNLTHGGRLEALDEPFRTITSANRGEKALVVADVTSAPFLANSSHGGSTEAISEPMRTITTEKGGSRSIVVPTLVQTGYGERQGQEPRALDIQQPLGTVVAGGSKHALVAAFVEQYYGGASGRPLTEPMGTVTTWDHHALVAASLVNMRGTSPDQLDRSAQALTDPLKSISSGGGHHMLVAAFMQQYFSNGENYRDISQPMGVATTKDRQALVTVLIQDHTFVISDIGMRMLVPRELARAMGFPDSFKFEAEGKPLTSTAAIKMIGNACPVNTTAALVRTALAARGIAAELPTTRG